MICAYWICEIESEREVAVTDKQFHELSEKVTEIRAYLKVAAWIVGPLAAAATGLGIWALSWCMNLSTSVAKLQQAVSDGGVTKLVTELKSPSSPDQLKANLSTVIAQVQTAKVNGAKPDQQKVKTLSDAISDVIQENPEMPEAWRAAAQLVSFRSGTQRATSSPDCLTKPHFAVMNNWAVDSKAGTKTPLGPDVWEMDNCTLVLDDIEAFSNSDDGKQWEAGHKEAPQRPLFIRLTNGHVVYHGGPSIPFTQLECVACTYEWELSAPPPSPEKKLTNELLRADNYTDIKVEGAM